MTEIVDIFAREILDSRGNPTVEVEAVLADGAFGKASVPGGASTGSHEALELRDKDQKRYAGKGVLKAVANVCDVIAQEIKGIDVFEQDFIDRTMCHLDDTENKAMLGANAILGVSMAVAQAASDALELPLYRYLGGLQARSLPVPVLNILSGGNVLDVQDIMIIPTGFSSYNDALRASAEVFHLFRQDLQSQDPGTSVTEKGSFAANVQSVQQAFELITNAIRRAGYLPEFHFSFGVDCGASKFYSSDTQKYKLKSKEEPVSSEELAAYYKTLFAGYPVIFIEDPFDREDWDAWEKFVRANRTKYIVGDELFQTNIQRIEEGAGKWAANAALIKLNQVGTVSEALEAIDVAKQFGLCPVISQRAGETEDTFIADFCVATGCRFFKGGGLCRAEHIVKYNQLLRIEEELGDSAIYAGSSVCRLRS